MLRMRNIIAKIRLKSRVVVWRIGECADTGRAVAPLFVASVPGVIQCDDQNS